MGVVFGGEQLMVVRVVQQGGQGDDLQVASGHALGNVHGVFVHPHTVFKVMPAGVAGKKPLCVIHRRFDDCHPPSSLRPFPAARQMPLGRITTWIVSPSFLPIVRRMD